ncbi:MAG TPA: EAL domain-containing protein, partial [Gemmataceae bacterium]|nr:EAL domain-containing protein [Gemmataceae bacterium]
MATAQPPDGSDPLPYLEYFPEPGGLPQRVALRSFPFTLGRGAGADLVVPSRQVSQAHAVITRDGPRCYIRDQLSTNGTFVNGQRVAEGSPLCDGDIVHLAHIEFRYGDGDDVGRDPAPMATEAGRSEPPPSLIRARQHLREMIVGGLAAALFQPIVRLPDRQVVAYEALGRGRHPQLPESPARLLDLAGRCGMAAEVSQMLRGLALAGAGRLPAGCLLFLNCHPEELRAGTLSRSLAEVPPGQRAARALVLEVHEDAVADVPTMRRLRADLRALDVRLAYDDFGAGQARLAELAAIPPDFVKLDRRLVEKLPRSGPLQDLVRTLSQVSARLSCQMLAEGVQTEEEAEVSRALGCGLGQGYLF